MRTIAVQIKGISPLLMARYPLEPIEGINKMTAKEVAEIAAYRDVNGSLIIPSLCLWRCLVNGATFVKGKGRATAQKPVAACVQIDPMQLDLGTKDYVIDSRRAVIPSTKGSIIAHRPRLNSWAVTFDLTYDERLLSEKEIRAVVDESGSRVGVLAFRPERKGPFGRFMVTSWKT